MQKRTLSKNVSWQLQNSRLKCDSFIINNIKIPSDDQETNPNQDSQNLTQNNTLKPTNAFGEIQFGKQISKAKYVRLSSQTKGAILYNLMTVRWKLGVPDLVVMVSGDIEELKNKPVHYKNIKEGLYRLISQRDSWVITDGSENSIGKFVSNAIYKTVLKDKNKLQSVNSGAKSTTGIHQNTCSTDYYRKPSLITPNSEIKSAHSLKNNQPAQIKMIGVANWRKVIGSDSLESGHGNMYDGTHNAHNHLGCGHMGILSGKYPAKYGSTIQNQLRLKNAVYLEPNHSAFLLTQANSISDDNMGKINLQLSILTGLRTVHRNLPSAFIMIGGNESTIFHAAACINNSPQPIPVILIANSGGFTDVLVSIINKFCVEDESVHIYRVENFNLTKFVDILALILPKDIDLTEQELNELYEKCLTIVESSACSVYRQSEHDKGAYLDYMVMKAVMKLIFKEDKNDHYCHRNQSETSSNSHDNDDTRIEPNATTSDLDSESSDSRYGKNAPPMVILNGNSGHHGHNGLNRNISSNSFRTRNNLRIPANSYLSQLKFAIHFDRIDLAQEILSNSYNYIPKKCLYDPFLSCMLYDKTHFIQLFLAEGLDLQKFLTPKRLAGLYLHGRPLTRLLIKIIQM